VEWVHIAGVTADDEPHFSIGASFKGVEIHLPAEPQQKGVNISVRLPKVRFDDDSLFVVVHI
jgi:hypothetical protein